MPSAGSPAFPQQRLETPPGPSLTQNCRTAAASLLAASALAGSAVVNAVLVVDDDGGPGVDFTSLQTAIDAATATDTILVKAGSYAAITIDGKSITMVADNAAVDFSGQSVIQNIAAGQSVVVNSISFTDGFGTSLTLSSNAGPVWLESVGVFSSGIPLFQPADGLVIGSSAAGVLADCQIAAGANPVGTAGAGLTGLRVSDATLHCFDSTVSGSLSFEGLVGGPGVSVSNSTLFASGCTFTGGPGEGNTPPFGFCEDGASGGAGLVLTFAANDVTLLDTSVVGGPGGAAGDVGCADGPSGTPTDVQVGPAPVDLGLMFPARNYDIPSPIRSDEVGVLEFTATPGELAWAIFSIGVAPINFPIFTEPSITGGSSPTPKIRALRPKTSKAE